MKHKIDQGILDAWHKDANNWKWGIFYYNPQDPRLFPPKLTYLGWTANFANPRSIVAMLGLILMVAIVSVCIVLAISFNWF